jgi:hypothetical protein
MVGVMRAAAEAATATSDPEVKAIFGVGQMVK